MITRKQYINNEVTHAEYYGQFATDAVKRLVVTHIGIEAIKASTDPHMNDIPLKRWDALYGSIRDLVGGSLAKANEGGGVSLSDTVCVAKAAAKIIKAGV